jgi:transcriptional regulator with XRE-family HTH domain
MAWDAMFQSRVAQLVYDVRTESSLSQKELAKLVGTTRSVIQRLEDADYDAGTERMLNRIATALHRRIEIRLLPEVKRKAA